MKKLIIISLTLTSSLLAQFSSASNNADCYYTETITGAAARTSAFDNRASLCDTWFVQIMNLSNGPVTYSIEYSTNNSSWSRFSNTNPTDISATSAGSSSSMGFQPYVAANIQAKGTGNVIVVLTGYSYAKNKNSSNSSAPDSVAYTTLIDVVSATLSYICTAKSIFDPDTNSTYAICQIQRITKDGSGNVTKVQNAAGSALEDQVWGNRAGLTYK